MRSFSILAALALTATLALPAHGEEGEGGGKKPKHKVTQSESYIQVEPAMYSMVLDDDRPVGMLMIGVGLDIPDAKLRGEAEHAMPVLRDAFVRNMLNYSTTSVRSWRQPDVVTIADRLQAVTDRALGRKGAKLLIAHIVMRLTK